MRLLPDRVRDQLAVWNQRAAGRPSALNPKAQAYRPPSANGPYLFGRESVMRHAAVKNDAFQAQLYVEEHDSAVNPHCNIFVRIDQLHRGLTGVRTIASYKLQVMKEEGADINEARTVAEQYIVHWNQAQAFADEVMTLVMPGAPETSWLPQSRPGPQPGFTRQGK